MIHTERLTELFVDVADTLIDDFDVVDFWHHLAEYAVEVTGADCAGLLLAGPDGTLHYLASAGRNAKELEMFQLEHSEGPCLDSCRTGEAIIVPDLRQVEARWPAFVPHALDLGIHSVHAFPLRLRHRQVGALNVFTRARGSLDATDARVAQALADVATIAILQERAIASAELLTEQLQGALNTRVVIEQAKGVISRQLGVDVDRAFVALRSHARSHHLRLADLAVDVVNGKVYIAPQSR